VTGLSLRAVSAGYRDRPVLHDVSADVPSGGWLAIVGPNGAGKSTLLKRIAGLLPGSGEVRIDGRAALSHKERARLIGYAPQDPVLPEGLTVTDYALLGRTPYLGPLARESAADLSIVDDVLTRLDLSAMAGRRLATLSGGERQRAVLARVLVQRTGLLLLDEPTTGLDLGHAQATLELVDRLRREDSTTIVSTLHDLTLAAQYADSMLLLSGGKVAASGTPSAVLTPEALAAHYGANAGILRGDGGELVIAPTRRAPSATPPFAD